jgi:hypothetical protein
LELKKKFLKIQNAPDFSKMMQIICNFRFWKIRLFKKYRTIFFQTTKWLHISKWRRPLQFLRFWTTIFLFFNRFSKKNMFWKHNFISCPFLVVCWFLFSKWRKFSDFLYFSSSSGVLNFKLLKLLCQNMIYWIFINKSWKQSLIIKARWRVVLKRCSLLYNICVLNRFQNLNTFWKSLIMMYKISLVGSFKIATNPIWRHLVHFRFWPIVFAFSNRCMYDFT